MVEKIDCAWLNRGGILVYELPIPSNLLTAGDMIIGYAWVIFTISQLFSTKLPLHGVRYVLYDSSPIKFILHLNINSDENMSATRLCYFDVLILHNVIVLLST